MKRICTYLLFLLLSISSFAGTYSPQTIPLDQVRANTTRVVNPDGILSSETCDSIDSYLLSLDSIQAYGVVAVCEHFEGDDPYEFAIGLGRELEIGGKKSQGFVIALATEDRSYWISTGEGMDKFVTDAICGRIERQYMVPYLKQGDWNNAMLNTTKAFHGYITGNAEYVEELSQGSDSSEDDGGGLGWMFMGGVASLVGFGIYSKRKERTCPHCKKVALELVSKERRAMTGHKYRIKMTYKCKNCSEIVYKDQVIDNTPSSGGTIGGAIGGSIFGGGSGGSGGGFGGLGGGSFGGGGAGGRF